MNWPLASQYIWLEYHISQNPSKFTFPVFQRFFSSSDLNENFLNKIYQDFHFVFVWPFLFFDYILIPKNGKLPLDWNLRKILIFNWKVFCHFQDFFFHVKNGELPRGVDWRFCITFIESQQNSWFCWKKLPLLRVK